MKNQLGNAALLMMFSSGSFFIFNFILAKLLGAEVYGEIQYYISFIQIISLSISFNYASLYMGSKILKGDKETLSLFISVQTFLFLMLFIPAVIILNIFIINKIVIVFILGISYLFVIMTSIGLEYNSDRDIISSILIGSIASRVLHIIFFVFIMWLGYSLPLHYLYTYFASIAIIVVYSIYQLRPRKYFNIKLFSRAWKFYLLGIIGNSFIYIAQIIQKEFYGYSQLAVLSISILIITGLGIWGSLLIKFVLPIAHEYWTKKDLNGISQIYKNNTYLELITILPLFLLILFNIERLSFSLGPNYANLPTMFYILSIGYLFNLVTGITGTLLRVTENEHFELFNEIIRLIIGLFLIYKLRHLDYGVVMAISISMVIYNLLKFLELFYLFKLWPLTKHYFLQTILISTWAAFLFFSASKIENIYLFIIATLIGLLITYSYSYYLIFINSQLLTKLRI